MKESYINRRNNIRFLYRLHNCIKYYYTDDCRIQITLTTSTNNRNIQIGIDSHKVQNTTQMSSRIHIFVLRLYIIPNNRNDGVHIQNRIRYICNSQICWGLKDILISILSLGL